MTLDECKVYKNSVGVQYVQYRMPEEALKEVVTIHSPPKSVTNAPGRAKNLPK